MNTQPTGENRPTTNQPNFNHRIDGDLSNSLDLADIIGMMTYRAKGVLDLLAINYNNGGIVADHVASAAIHAAIAEIEDINATIQAFHQLAAGKGGVQ